MRKRKTKRTRRYGGFLIGDRVRPKNKATFDVIGDVVVDGYMKGEIIVKLNAPIQFDNIYFPIDYMSFMPNQLINLTRIEEKKITDPLPPMNEETADELIERIQRMQMENWKPEDHDIMPPQFHLKDMLGEDYQFEQDGDEPTPDPLPSPYERDVYTTTNDY